jgi:hypothetical protein
MTPARHQGPESAPSFIIGRLALDRDARRLPVPSVAVARSCRWPRAAEPTTPGVGIGPDPGPWDIVDEWGVQSFPASDPPANW